VIKRNQFIIHNTSPKPLVLNIEPEASSVPLLPGEEVTVTESFKSAPVTIRVNASEQGETILSIWPGDGNVCVRKDGTDVLDIVAESVEAELP
jgi:hypothetical protein